MVRPHSYSRIPVIPVLLSSLLILATGCEILGSRPEGIGRAVTYTFEDSADEWKPGFADYPRGDERDMELRYGRGRLPAPLDTTRYGLRLSGLNTSDDLFMYLKRYVPGLTPHARYRVHFELQIASASPSGCVGIGGPPGESVFLKAGAAPREPRSTIQEGIYRMNVDKGNQASGGAHAEVIGNAANGVNQCHDTPYRLIRRASTPSVSPTYVRTGADGAIWIFVGSDSGFEGRTTLVYDKIHVTFEPAPS